MAGDLFAANASVLTWFQDENIYITAGDLAREGHPVMKGREDMFEPVQVRFEVSEPGPKPAARTAAKKAG
jgi:hypothetical protein